MDMDLEKIHNSEHFSNDEKIRLTSLLTDAAECTNGLTEYEKVQNLSEITFGVVTAVINITEQLNENNRITKEVKQSLDEFKIEKKQIEEEVHQLEKRPTKNNIKDLDWKATLKLCLVKPWIWIFLSVVTFSPKGLEVLNLLIDKFGN